MAIRSRNNGLNMRLGCSCNQPKFGAAPSWYDNSIAAITAGADTIWNDTIGIWSQPMDTSGGFPITSSIGDANLVGQPGYGGQSTLSDTLTGYAAAQGAVNNVASGLVTGVEAVISKVGLYAVLGVMAYVLITDKD
jgi:hypothetical protein